MALGKSLPLLTALAVSLCIESVAADSHAARVVQALVPRQTQPSSMSYDVNSPWQFSTINADFLQLNPDVHFVLQSDGQMVVRNDYPDAADGPVVWVSGKDVGFDCANLGCSVHWQTDGQLVVFHADNPVWVSGTAHTGTRLVFSACQAHPAIAILDSSGNRLWSTPSTGNEGGVCGAPAQDPGGSYPPPVCGGCYCLPNCNSA